jgi:Subtilase family
MSQKKQKKQHYIWRQRIFDQTFLINKRLSVMKKIWTLAAISMLCFSIWSCQKPENNKTLARPVAPNPTDLDNFIKGKLLETGEFWWKSADDQMVWTALANTDFVMSVGYQPAGETNLDERLPEIDIQKSNWIAARIEVISLILNSEKKTNPNLTEANLMAFEESKFVPNFNVFVRNPATIKVLRASNLVRFAEPTAYEPFQKAAAQDRSGTSGCGFNVAATGLVSGVDYATLTPGCKQSWNHSFHKITEAWANGAKGGETQLMIIDTGCSDDQENLGSAFNQGQSSGRNILKWVTLPQETNWLGYPIGLPETPHDQCGHGTSMIGAAASPRGTDGNNCGIAYQCNIISCRAAADVLLDESREIVGVSNAFIQGGNTTSLKVMSMSMGRLTSSNQIRDAIIYAKGQGKMIFCAAGTSFSWTSWFVGVIFPATMTQVVAVTGVKNNLTSACYNCHTGSKVDFVVVMERTQNARTPLSVAMYGDDPSEVGGSSVATASTAAIAALVWSKNPSWNSTQVFNKMKISSNYYPTRNPSFGWGRVNAQLATQ